MKHTGLTDHLNHIKQVRPQDGPLSVVKETDGPTVWSGVTVQNNPPPLRKYTPGMLWLDPRQNAMVVDLFIETFGHYQFHHKLINVIDGCM